VNHISDLEFLTHFQDGDIDPVEIMGYLTNLGFHGATLHDFRQMMYIKSYYRAKVGKVK
jgi:hypothetical protein